MMNQGEKIFSKLKRLQFIEKGRKINLRKAKKKFELIKKKRLSLGNGANLPENSRPRASKILDQGSFLTKKIIKNRGRRLSIAVNFTPQKRSSTTKVPKKMSKKKYSSGGGSHKRRRGRRRRKNNRDLMLKFRISESIKNIFKVLLISNQYYRLSVDKERIQLFILSYALYKQKIANGFLHRSSFAINPDMPSDLGTIQEVQ